MEITKDIVVKILRTSLLVAAWFCMGLRLSVHYATIPDQRTRLNTTTDKLNYAFAIGSIGGLAGPPLAAISDRFQNHADLYFSCLITAYGFLFALKPCVLQLWIYTVIEFFEGVVMSVCSPVGNSLILAMWEKNSQPAMQIFGLGWSVGGIFGPLIAIPFVSVEEETENNNSTPDSSANDAYASTSSRKDRYPDDSKIEVAFWIVALCFIFVAFLFVVLYVIFKPQAARQLKSYSWKEILYPAKWSGGDISLGIKVFVLFVLAFICFTGTYNGPSTLLTTYASDSALGFDNQEAALLSSAYNLCGSTGRVIVICISKWVKVTPLLAVLTHGTVTGAVLMAVLGTKTKTGLWATSCFFALFYRPIWGCLYTWTNNYIILLAAIIGVQGFINSIFSIFITSMQGYLYENTTPDSIFYTAVVYGALLCVVFYFMFCLGYNRKTRYEKASEETTEVFVVTLFKSNSSVAVEKDENSIKCTYCGPPRE